MTKKSFITLNKVVINFLLVFILFSQETFGEDSQLTESFVNSREELVPDCQSVMSAGRSSGYIAQGFSSASQAGCNWSTTDSSHRNPFTEVLEVAFVRYTRHYRFYGSREMKLLTRSAQAFMDVCESRDPNEISNCEVDQTYRWYYPCHPGAGVPGGPYSYFDGHCNGAYQGDNDFANHGDDENNTCNPVNISTGNKFFVDNGFVGRGASPLKYNWFYNSGSGSWSYDYQQKLSVNSINFEVITERPSGEAIMIGGARNRYVSPPHRLERLTFSDDTYELRLADNTIEIYDVSGQLQSIRYPSGITHDLTYSNDGNTITVTRLNESLVLDLVDGNVVKAMLPDNSEINYTWDTSGTIDNLTQVTYADNSTRTYVYENNNFPHYITGIVDENGNRISSVEYDTLGRAISSEVGTPNSGIERTEIQYHSDGTRTVTNSLGKQNTYHFTQFNGEYKMTQVEGHASANCASANQAYTYDANGFMASKTDWKGNVTTYVHNDRGLETSRTEASGTPEARTITTEWHPTFNLRTKITEPERETVISYDSEGRLISQEVSPR